MRPDEKQFKAELPAVLVETFKRACKAQRPRTTVKGVTEMLIENWLKEIGVSLQTEEKQGDPSEDADPGNSTPPSPVVPPQPGKGDSGGSHGRQRRK